MPYEPDIEYIQDLLEEFGVNPNKKIFLKNTTLYCAAAKGCTFVFRYSADRKSFASPGKWGGNMDSVHGLIGFGKKWLTTTFGKLEKYPQSGKICIKKRHLINP